MGEGWTKAEVTIKYKYVLKLKLKEGNIGFI
jgi:hypothetical protein